MRLGTIRPAAGATKDTKRRGKGSATGLGGTGGRHGRGHGVQRNGFLHVEPLAQALGHVLPRRLGRRGQPARQLARQGSGGNGGGSAEQSRPRRPAGRPRSG